MPTTGIFSSFPRRSAPPTAAPAPIFLEPRSCFEVSSDGRRSSYAKFSFDAMPYSMDHLAPRLNGAVRTPGGRVQDQSRFAGIPRGGKMSQRVVVPHVFFPCGGGARRKKKRRGKNHRQT